MFCKTQTPIIRVIFQFEDKNYRNFSQDCLAKCILIIAREKNVSNSNTSIKAECV